MQTSTVMPHKILRPWLSIAAFMAVTAAMLLGSLTHSAHAANGERRGAPPGKFDFYVLALSWSPGFCELNGDRKGLRQCRTGSHLGFVVHGLWPQYEDGYPSECRGVARTPSRAALASVAGLYPDEGLARYEWRRHGTCSGKSPTDYFNDVSKARAAITIPEPFRAPATDQMWTPIDLERAFIAVNKGLRTDMMSITCRHGTLEEVRVCFTKDLRRFRTCPEVDLHGCRGGDLQVDAVR